MRQLLLAWLIILFIPFQAMGKEGAKDWLSLSKFTHTTATDFHQWYDSDFHPRNIEIFAKENQWVKEDYKQLCQLFKKESKEDLVLFIDFIPEGVISKECLNELKSKQNDFLHLAAASIQVQIPPGVIEGRSGGMLGPSLVKSVPVGGGPVYFNASDVGVGYKEIALTFDDGPHGTNTKDLLEILKANDVQVNFFVVGRNTLKYPQILQQTSDLGHSMGIHTQNHKNLPKFSYDTGVDEIMTGFESVIEVLGWAHPFFRFPYGARTTRLQNFLREESIPTFFWNMDTLDWKIKDPQQLYEYTIEQVKKAESGIILFHDIQPQTIQMMPKFLRFLKLNGYKPVIFEAEKIYGTNRKP